MNFSGDRTSHPLPSVEARNGVELLLPGAPECPEVVCFGIFSIQKWYVVFVFPVNHRPLRLSQPNNFADRRYARIHRAASDMLLVTCKWRYCCRFWALHGVNGVPIGALLVVLQQWLLVSSHVSGWLTSVEVFAAVPLGVPCFLSCWVGRYFVAHWNVGAQAGCFIAAFGYRRHPRHARTSRVLEVGKQWHGCNCS